MRPKAGDLSAAADLFAVGANLCGKDGRFLQNWGIALASGGDLCAAYAAAALAAELREDAGELLAAIAEALDGKTLRCV